jgi:hypothetical protein
LAQKPTTTIIFLSCEYPKPMAITCPECGGDVTEKVMRKRRETTTEFRSFSQSRLQSSPCSSSSPVGTGTPSEPKSVVLDADEIADYEELRSLVSPEKSLALLDDFAKWLFAVAAVVGKLGASFGISNANDLKGAGRTTFAWAVAAVGGSLALAAFTRLPLPGASIVTAMCS